MLSAVTAMNHALRIQLEKVKGLTVREEWPTANLQLVYPTITLFRKNPEFTNLQAYVLSTSDPDVNNLVTTKYVIGQYDLKMQLDLWCRNKDEREKVFQQVFDILNPDVPKMGLSLQLKEYHDIWVRFDVVGHEFVDDEAGAQRQEWRTRFDLLAQCKAVREKSEFSMITIENQVTTPDTI